jgi:hypothetical protein
METTAVTTRSIGITIQIDPEPMSAPVDARNKLERPGHLLRVFHALLSLAIGALLVLLALPRAAAAWFSLEARPALEKLQSGRLPTDLELGGGISGLKNALSWTTSARRLTDLGLLELEQGERLPEGNADRAALLGNAERHLTEGLAEGPANGFAWFRLALVREMRHAPSRQTAAALGQSLDVAPNMRKLWLPRASLFFFFWRDLTFEELVVLRAHIRTVWAADVQMRLPLLQAAALAGQLPVLSWMLSEDPPSAEDVRLFYR